MELEAAGLGGVWFAVVRPRPAHWGRPEEFKSVVSCTTSTVAWCFIRRSVCVRCVCRMLARFNSGAALFRKRKHAFSWWGSPPAAWAC